MKLRVSDFAHYQDLASELGRLEGMIVLLREPHSELQFTVRGVFTSLEVVSEDLVHQARSVALRDFERRVVAIREVFLKAGVELIDD